MYAPVKSPPTRAGGKGAEPKPKGPPDVELRRRIEETPGYWEMGSKAKQTLRSRCRKVLKDERVAAGVSFPEQDFEEEERPPSPVRSVTTGRRPRESRDDQLLEAWASGEIPVPEDQEEEERQFERAAEESRGTRRRVEEEGTGGASGSRGVLAAPPAQAESEGAEQSRITRIRQRTARWEDPQLITLWERYEHLKDQRGRAFREQDFRSSAYFHADMNDLVARVEQREAELQEEDLDRRYAPPSKGKGSKGKGKSSSSYSAAPKKARTWH
jgi:hypothetical protein